MNGCEEYRMKLSALLDGELPPEDLPDTVRHLAGCEACMKQFQAFQALQQRVNQEVAAPAVPNRLWTAIKRESSAAQAAIHPYRPLAGRILRLAAVIVICFGLGYMLSKPVFRLQKADPQTPIVLASSPGSMTDERFLEVTRELLTADPAYHRKMYLILSLLMDRYGEGNLQSLRESQTPVPATPVMETTNGGKIEAYKY